VAFVKFVQFVTVSKRSEAVGIKPYMLEQVAAIYRRVRRATQRTYAVSKLCALSRSANSKAPAFRGDKSLDFQTVPPRAT